MNWIQLSVGTVVDLVGISSDRSLEGGRGGGPPTTSRLKLRNEHLLDIGAEAFAVDRTSDKLGAVR